MQRLGFSRRATLFLTAFGGLMLLACLGLAAYLVATTSLWRGGASPGAPITWSSLPTPTRSRARWTSHTFAGQINDLALRDDLLWAATDGGLVVISLADSKQVKFTAEHGLAGNRVRRVAVGPDGAIWLATAGGVNRYDGRAWQTFTTADGLAADSITDLLIDRRGDVWAATPAGLSRYDGRRWRTFSGSGLLAPLPAGAARVLALAPNNDLWVGTATGVSRYDGRTWQTFTTDAGLSSDDVRALTVMPNGELWVGGDAGLIRFDGDAWTRFTLPPPRNALPVARLHPAPNGALWIGFGAAGGGLMQFDPRTNSILAAFSALDALPSAQVHALLLDARGDLWAGTGQGIAHFKDRAWETLTPPSALPSHAFHALLQTPDALWAATDAGVGRFDGAWQTVTRANGLADDDVRALAQGPDGALWAAFTNPLQGLSRRGADGLWRTLRCDVAAPPSRAISDGLVDAAGVFWFATDNGIGRYDGAAWRHETTVDGLPHNEAHALALDAEGRLWAGTAGGLALRLADRWIMMTPDALTQLAIAPNGTVWAITEGRVARLLDERLAARLAARRLLPVDPALDTAVRAITAADDGVWAATPEGVAHFNGTRWRRFTTADGLPANDVTAVTRAADGTVWAATSGDAQEIDFTFFDGARWRPHPNSAQGSVALTNNAVGAILATPDGAVWLGTANGLNRYANGQWSAFDPAEGPLGREVRALAYAFDSVWAITEKGLAQYDGRRWIDYGSAAHGPGPSRLSRLLTAPDGSLWVATANFGEGLRVYNGQRWLSVSTPPTDAALSAATFDPDGRLWVAGEHRDTRELFFGFYDPATRGWTWQLPGMQPFPISALAWGPDERLWIGAANGQGLFVRDVGHGDVGHDDVGHGGLGTVVDAFPEPANPQIIRTSPDGALWVGAADGLYRWNGRAWASQPVPIPFVRHIFALEFAPDGSLWVGAEQGAARGQDGSWETFYAPPQPPGWWGSVQRMQVRADGAIVLGTSVGGIGLFTGRGFAGDRPSQWQGQALPVTAVFNAPNNDLWVGTQGGGAARLDGVRWTLYAPSPALTAPLRGLGFSRDGAAWLGSAAGIVGVAGLNSAQCTFSELQEGITVLTARSDASGGVWFGSEDQGAIYRAGLGQAPQTRWEGAPVRVLTTAPGGEVWFVNARQDWLSYTAGATIRRTPLKRDLVTADAITALALAPNLTVWIGAANGAVAFNGRDWSTLTTRDGLADNAVMHVLVEPNGTVWFATPGGLSQYQP